MLSPIVFIRPCWRRQTLRPCVLGMCSFTVLHTSAIVVPKNFHSETWFQKVIASETRIDHWVCVTQRLDHNRNVSFTKEQLCVNGASVARLEADVHRNTLSNLTVLVLLFEKEGEKSSVPQTHRIQICHTF